MPFSLSFLISTLFSWGEDMGAIPAVLLYSINTRYQSLATTFGTLHFIPPFYFLTSHTGRVALFYFVLPLFGKSKDLVCVFAGLVFKRFNSVLKSLPLAH